MIAAVAGLIFATTAQAQPRGTVCGPHSDLVAQLFKKYGETRWAYGIGRNGNVFEVYASESGSWTITVTGTGGQTCIAASGEAFEVMYRAPAPRTPLPQEGQP